MSNTINSDFNKEQILYCCYCNKECHNKNSLLNHQCRCPKNPNRRDFNNLKNPHIINKGDTWYNNPVVAKARESLIKRYASGYVSPMKGKEGTFKGKHHSLDTCRKIGQSVSETRLKHYAEGKLSPAKGVGRGKYSYIIYDNNKYMLRSTYEFIYALYLSFKGISFKVEDIRVPAQRENPYGKTFISDFSFDNTVVEIKGIPSGKDIYIRESFESAGYTFVELFHKDIQKCKEFLVDKGVPVDELLEKVISGHNTKNYFIYTI